MKRTNMNVNNKFNNQVIKTVPTYIRSRFLTNIYQVSSEEGRN